MSGFAVIMEWGERHHGNEDTEAGRGRAYENSQQISADPAFVIFKSLASGHYASWKGVMNEAVPLNV